MKLNETAVRKLPPPATGYTIFRDDEMTGFAVRVTANGAKSFVLGYSVDGRERRMTIGKYPAWSATAARQRVRELRQLIDRGVDPLGDKLQRRQAPTFADIAKEYLERHAVNKKSGKEYAAALEREVLPEWGRRKAEDIKRRDVIALVEAKAKSAPIAANRLLALVRGMYNWAISRDLLEYNPCFQVKPPAKEQSRDRVLSADEIRVMWSALDDAPLTPTVVGILRFILVVGQRPGEVSTAEWTEVDGDWWTIAGSKTKNQLAHRVPLSSLALEILSNQPQTSKYIFPCRYQRKNTHTSESSAANAVNRSRYFGLPRWTPHDLRRTAATTMASLGVARFVIGRVLNHAEPGVTKIYDRHSYDPEKRAALEKWERRLRAIISEPAGGKVVSIG